MMNNVELPNVARDRLRDLEIMRMSSEDAARGTANRVNGLPHTADAELRNRLTTERDRQNVRQGQLSRLLSKLQQWLGSLPAGTALEVAPAVAADIKSGETVGQAIARVRDAITAVSQHLRVVRGAPLPKLDQKKLAADYVARLAQTARPGVAIVKGELKVNFRGEIAAAEDVAALLAWLSPRMLTEAIEEEIDGMPDTRDPLPAAERERRAAELAAQLDQLERQEESLIERARGDGLDVLRRPDASPAAVLGVRVAARAAQAA